MQGPDNVSKLISSNAKMTILMALICHSSFRLILAYNIPDLLTLQDQWHLGLFIFLQRANGLEKQTNAIGHLSPACCSIIRLTCCATLLHVASTSSGAHLVLTVPRINLVKGTLKPGLPHIRRLIEPESKKHLPLSSTA